MKSTCINIIKGHLCRTINYFKRFAKIVNKILFANGDLLELVEESNKLIKTDLMMTISIAKPESEIKNKMKRLRKQSRFIEL
jgi:hypothetical protein